MTHENARRAIQSGADELSAVESAALQAHLAACPECRAYAAQLDTLRPALTLALHGRWDAARPGAELAQKVQEQLRRRAMRKSILQSAVAVLGALAILGVLVLARPLLTGDGGPMVKTTDDQLPTTAEATDDRRRPMVDATGTMPRDGETVTYIVQEGDTLTGIASLYGISVEAIRAANSLDAAGNIIVGQILIIPLAAPTAVSGQPSAVITPVTGHPSSVLAATHPILGDVRVRRALAYCTDKEVLARAVYPWLEETDFLIMDSFVNPQSWAYGGDEPGFVRYPYDLAQGMALLEEAGWVLPEGGTTRVNAAGDELAFTLSTTTAEFRQTLAAAWQAQMAACGVRVERNHIEATVLFGDESGLQRRDFEVALFSWAWMYDPNGRYLYVCDRIPAPENGWQGQNYGGWCNPVADAAIRQAVSSLNEDTRRAAYAIAQVEYTRDVPVIPLFARLEVSAAAGLEGFTSTPGEVYTWNAAQWRIPGRDTIILGERSEPAGLLPSETAYVSDLLRALIAGVDVARVGYTYKPVLLAELPSGENGLAMMEIVEVQEGDEIVDADGNAAPLAAGLRIRNSVGEEVVYAGGAAQMRQLSVRYEFVEGLTWSDGTPVSAADYELGYRFRCAPESAVFWGEWRPTVCSQIAGVQFASDTTYVVTWKPGYQDALYFLPPFSRLPAHQLLPNGQRLGETPFDEWQFIDEINSHPLGVGPYVMSEWVYGERMVFTANPYYYKAQPATPNIVVKIIEQGKTAAALASGEVDIVGWDSLSTDAATMEILLRAENAGKVKLYYSPSTSWEHIDFNLSVK